VRLSTLICSFLDCTYDFVTFIDYVLQRALAVVEGEQKEVLIAMVRPQLAIMQKYSSAYSKHLISSTPSPDVMSLIVH